MKLKKRAFLLILAFWLPLQGLAGTLLYCNNSPTDAVIGEHLVSHQDHTPPVAEAVHEPTDSTECGTRHHSIGHNGDNLDNCEHCQQCCQMGASLIISPTLFTTQPHSRLKAWLSERADSIVPEPLFHPPQHLS